MNLTEVALSKVNNNKNEQHYYVPKQDIFKAITSVIFILFWKEVASSNANDNYYHQTLNQIIKQHYIKNYLALRSLKDF